MNLNKRGGIIKFKFFLLLIILIAMLFIFIKISHAESSVTIINVTLMVNSSNVVLNITNNLYNFNNSAFTFALQQNFTFFYVTNVTNSTVVASNVSCSNSSVSAVSVSCNCPSSSCPSTNFSCNFPSQVDLLESSKDDLKKKIEESSNKVSQDVIFKLEPSTTQLDNYKDRAFNSSIKEQEAKRERDNFASQNLALSQVIEGKNFELRMMMIGGLTVVLVLVFFLFATYGSEIFERFKGYGGAGTM